jgi:hypothetical protein
MKTNHLKFAPALLVALFATGNAVADSIDTTDYLQWAETSPGVLTVIPNTPPIPDAAVLAGNAAAPGGNVELGQLGAGTTRTTLTVNTAGGDLLLSSLINSDWGTSGSGGLLDQWTNDLFSYYGASIGMSQDAFKTLFVQQNGREAGSDPNISYAYADANGLAHIGLAGFLDANQGYSFLPAGAQISEIVRATYQGQTKYLYGMGPGSATPSNVSTADGSYTGNYEVTIPEPTELALLVAGLTGFLGLRRKAVKA